MESSTAGVQTVSEQGSTTEADARKAHAKQENRTIGCLKPIIDAYTAVESTVAKDGASVSVILRGASSICILLVRWYGSTSLYC